MKNISIRFVAELIAVIGVVLSLIFVGFELRQNTIAARSAAFQEIGVATAQGWLERSLNRELSDILLKANSTPSAYHDLSDSDRGLVRAWLLSFVRLSETIYLQIDQGLLDEQAFDTLGYGEVTFGSASVGAAWPEMRPQITPGFAQFVEARYPNLAQQIR